MFGLFTRDFSPLALMVSANQVPILADGQIIVLDKARGVLGIAADSFAITTLVLLSRCVLLVLQMVLIL